MPLILNTSLFQIIEPAKDSSPVKPAQIPTYDNLPYYSDIEAILGPVILVSPHNDYLALETGTVTTSRNVDTDLPNIVELYDFPAEFKTDQLVTKHFYIVTLCD